MNCMYLIVLHLPLAKISPVQGVDKVVFLKKNKVFDVRFSKPTLYNFTPQGLIGSALVVLH